MTSIELAVVIGGVLASFTMCAVKIIHQIQNSKCRFIKCLGVECVRDTEIDLPEVRTGAVSSEAGAAKAGAHGWVRSTARQ
jgi:hypothetical protein